MLLFFEDFEKVVTTYLFSPCKCSVCCQQLYNKRTLHRIALYAETASTAPRRSATAAALAIVSPRALRIVAASPETVRIRAAGRVRR